MLAAYTAKKVQEVEVQAGAKKDAAVDTERAAREVAELQKGVECGFDMRCALGQRFGKILAKDRWSFNYYFICLKVSVH